MRRPLHRRLAVAAAVLAHLALGAAYAHAVPPWEAPDEPWHAAYAVALAEGRLPTADETYEHHHPPLAYAWFALGIRLAGIEALPVGEANPRYPFAAAALQHPPGDPLVGRVRFLRTWGGLLAALAVALAFAAARAAGGGVGVAWAAAGVVAAWPQFAYIGHTVSNDGLATVAGGLLWWVVARMCREAARRRGRPRSPAATGALAFAAAAAAVLTKLNAAVLVPAVVGLALLAGARARRGARVRSGPPSAGFAAAAAAVAGVLSALALLSIAAPPAFDALVDQVRARAGPTARPLPPAFARDTLESLWARFGWANVDLPRAVALTAAAAAAAALAGLRHIARRDAMVTVAATALVATAVTAFAASALADPQPQGRLLLPALPAAAWLLALGWRAWPARWSRRTLGATAVVAATAAHAAALAVVLPRAYAVDAAAPPSDAIVVRHLPAPWRVVATLAEGDGATLLQPSRAAHDGLRRIELPIVVREPGTVRLTVARGNGVGGSVGGEADGEVVGGGEGDVIGQIALPVEVTRARPWHGEARVRPVWVGVDVAEAVAAGEAVGLTVGVEGGAVVAVWGGEASGDGSPASNDEAGGGWFGELLRYEVYGP